MSFIDTMKKIGSNVSAALSPVSAVSGAIGGVSSLIGGIGQGRRDRRTARYNYELAERAADNQYNRQVQLMNLQNDQNIKNWNMQNEYNTPAAVRKRIEDAGLNPALMYGSSAGSVTAGGIQGGTPASAPGAVGAGTLPIGYQGDNLERMARIAQMNAQTGNIEAQTDKIKAETDTEAYQQKYLSALTGLTSTQTLSEGLRQVAQQLEIDFMNETFLTRVETTNEQYNSLKEQTKLFKNEAELAFKRGKLTDQEVNNLEKTYEMLCDQAVITSIQRTIKETYGMDMAANDIQLQLESISQLSAQTGLLKEQGRRMDFENDQYIRFHQDNPQMYDMLQRTYLDIMDAQADQIQSQADLNRETAESLSYKRSKDPRNFWSGAASDFLQKSLQLGGLFLSYLWFMSPGGKVVPKGRIGF